MALTGQFSPNLTSQTSSFNMKPFGIGSNFRQKHIPIKKIASPSLKIRASFNDKVFEDRSNGIICYKDESGELVCEGMDEGPRYSESVQRKFTNHRDAEILDFQQRWINFVYGTELNPVSAARRDIKSNGFNSFR